MPASYGVPDPFGVAAKSENAAGFAPVGAGRPAPGRILGKKINGLDAVLLFKERQTYPCSSGQFEWRDFLNEPSVSDSIHACADQRRDRAHASPQRDGAGYATVEYQVTLPVQATKRCF